MTESTINKLLSTLGYFLIGFFSGIINFMYGVVKGNIFSIMLFFFYGFIGGFVAIVSNEFIPQDWSYRIGLIYVCGALGEKLMGLMNRRGVNILETKFLGGEEKKEVEKPKEETISDNI